MTTEVKYKITNITEKIPSGSILSKLPPKAQQWAESLPWEQRRYFLSLCHLMCASSPEMQAEFLDDYTADGLVSRMLQDTDTQERVNTYLQRFRIPINTNQIVLRSYIRQFFIHSSQDARRQPEMYLEAALRLVVSTEEQNHFFNYMLGFEILKMIFQMSWLQQERLTRIQKNQEYFIKTYIKPIQHAHKINGIVVPKDERVFFAKRDYFVQQPDIHEKKLIELVMATFTTNIVIDFGFYLIRHVSYLFFDYDYIYNLEQEGMFSQ